MQLGQRIAAQRGLSPLQQGKKGGKFRLGSHGNKIYLGKDRYGLGKISLQRVPAAPALKAPKATAPQAAPRPGAAPPPIPQAARHAMPPALYHAETKHPARSFLHDLYPDEKKPGAAPPTASTPPKMGLGARFAQALHPIKKGLSALGTKLAGGKEGVAALGHVAGAAKAKLGLGARMLGHGLKVMGKELPRNMARAAVKKGKHKIASAWSNHKQRAEMDKVMPHFRKSGLLQFKAADLLKKGNLDKAEATIRKSQHHMHLHAAMQAAESEDHAGALAAMKAAREAMAPPKPRSEKPKRRTGAGKRKRPASREFPGVGDGAKV